MGRSRSLVYWFLPTRLFLAGGRPVFLWEVLGGGRSGGEGAVNRVLFVLAPRAELVRDRGSGDG